MRAELARRAGQDPDHYTARIGRVGKQGTHLVLEDVRHAATGQQVTDHVWFPVTHEFEGLRAGDHVRFSAPVKTYSKAGAPSTFGTTRTRDLDYGFGRPSYVEKTAMTIYQTYLMMKRADAIPPVPVTLPAPAPDLDLKVLGGHDPLEHHIHAQTHGYVPVATLQGEGGSVTHIVYTHRRGWNAAQKLLHGDPARFVVAAHGLVHGGEGTTPPGGGVVPVKYG